MSPEVYIQMGLGANDHGDWAAAHTIWAEMRAKYPENVWGHLWEAWASHRLGNGAEALNRLWLAIDAGLEVGPLASRICEIALERHDWQQALSAFKRLTKTEWLDDAGLDRLAFWIIREMRSGPHFPPSVFDMDEALLSRVMVPTRE